MADYKQKVDKIQEELNNRKLELARLQERRKTLDEDQENIKAKINDLGIDENNLKKEAEILNEQIEAWVERTEKEME